MIFVSRVGLALLCIVILASTKAFGETSSPSVHWGSLAFPDQYSTLTTGLTLNRFTPTDGTGAKYDSTVPSVGVNRLSVSPVVSVEY